MKKNKWKNSEKKNQITTSKLKIQLANSNSVVDRSFPTISYNDSCNRCNLGFYILHLRFHRGSDRHRRRHRRLDTWGHYYNHYADNMCNLFLGRLLLQSALTEARATSVSLSIGVAPWLQYYWYTTSFSMG